MITFTIQAFKQIGAWFTLLCFKSREINLEVHLVILGKIMVVFWFVKFIIFNTPRFLSSAGKCYMPLFLAVLALRNTRIYISSLYYSNVASYIEALINKHFS